MKTSQERKQNESVKKGDLYALGDHLLFCGNATSTKFFKEIPQTWIIKMILTDPPYGVDYVKSKTSFRQNQKHKSIENDQIQSNLKYKNFTKKWLNAIKNNLAEKNSFYIFNSDKMLFSLEDALRESDFKLSQLLIWIKNASVMGRLDYQPQHELIAYGWYGKHEFLKSKDKSVIAYPRTRRNVLHPTMKPLGLLRRIILNSTKIGDTVYDPFGGSGSVLISCEQTRRKCFMVEIDPDYCKVILNRFRKISDSKIYLLTNLSK